MLGHPAFRAKIREWLKTLRKANCLVLMATQSLSDAANSGILDVIVESTATKIFLPNLYARDEDTAALYRRMGLNTRQIEILATAVPKGDRFDWLIEKATELGVTRIIPLVTARSSVDPREGKLDKLRQTIIAACKQCGRNHLLELSAVTAWSDFVRTEFSNRAAFIAHPSSDPVDLAPEIIDFSRQPSLLFVIGPEGGFTDEEVAWAMSCGAKGLRLGSLVLRIETAAIALAALAIQR